MIHQIRIRVLPEIWGDEKKLKASVSRKLSIPKNEITHIEVLHKSIDARQKLVQYELTLAVYQNENFQLTETQFPPVKNVNQSKSVVVVGMGPAGLFSAIRLIELGIKPIILERGKNVKDRVTDLQGINVHNRVNLDSNYCFGEGGAGTYSDGKLYTRSHKRGNVQKILEYFVRFGAKRDILIEAHPHIGTNLLPGIIRNMREFILENGGEVHFGTRVTNFNLDQGMVQAVETLEGKQIVTNNLILATGHSARDIFELLNKKGIQINLKPLAIGVRVEHPQSYVDSMQYHTTERGKFLPPAEYSLVKQIENRGVYSFCMCPGGVIAPCATQPEQIVTNGWSASSRSRSTANSGIVVELKLEDFIEFEEFGPLAAMKFQESIEKRAWKATDGSGKAPAQRLSDFVSGKQSADLPKTSYPPGIQSVELGNVLPKFIYTTLQKGFLEFEKTRKGYISDSAIVHAPETRTSSPVHIPRDPITLQHTEVKGLYPCGEGAGYAGGIISAAMDGWKVAEACAVTNL